MPLTSSQIQTLQNTLFQMKKETERLLDHRDHFGTELEMIKESMGELSNYDNHPADHGTMLYEREKDLALNEHAKEQLDEIDQALQRMAEGAYGFCETCGKEIPYERLEAHPTATRCVQHSSDRSVSRERPVEEDILEPAYGKFEYDERDQTLFDAEDAWQRVANWGTSETPSDFIGHAKKSYNEMYPESDERVGYVEAVEGIVVSDISGNEEEAIPMMDDKAYEGQVMDTESK